MTRGSAFYIWGRKHAFPWGERWVSGPHDRDEAFSVLRRIEPFYPDAHLSVRIRSGKSLPTCTPRRAPPSGSVDVGPQFDLTRVTGRRAAALAISDCVERLGLVAVTEDWDGEPDVDIRTPSLGATIWLGNTPAAPMPIISWYGAAHDLRAVPGAWHEADINFAHRRKATSLPTSWARLFEALEIGLLASIDGTAFDAR